MKKRTASLLFLLLLAILTGCHKHTWEPATCTEPQICSECGKTRGDSLGHDWQPANCTEPETCVKCGETRGDALGHVSGDWIIEQEATFAENGKRVKRCTRCNEILEEDTFSISIFENGKYICTANELAARIQTHLDASVPGLAVHASSDGEVTNISVQKGSDLICAISFPGESKITSTDMALNTPIIVSMLISTDQQLNEDVEAAIVMACDPSITVDIAHTILKQCKQDQKQILQNEISYYIQSFGFVDTLYTGTQDSISTFLEEFEEKSKLPYFEMNFSDFVAKHNETYAAENLEIRKVDTGYSYYLNDKMLGIIFAEDLNEKKDDNKITAYKTAGKDESFNLIKFRMIDKNSGVIDTDRFTLALMTGSVMVTPLTEGYNIDEFLAHQKVIQNSDRRIEMVYMNGNIKYTMSAQSDLNPIAQVYYEFTCELT